MHMTLGERGHPALSGREYAEQKRVEAMEAGRILGADVEILPFLDGGCSTTRSQSACWPTSFARKSPKSS